MAGETFSTGEAILRRLARIVALLNDPGASVGERANCRAIAEKLSSELGVALDRAAIENALAAEHREPRSLVADIVRVYDEFEAAKRKRGAQARSARKSRADKTKHDGAGGVL